MQNQMQKQSKTKARARVEKVKDINEGKQFLVIGNCEYNEEKDIAITSMHQQDHSGFAKFNEDDLVFQNPKEYGIMQVNNEYVVLACLIK